MPSDAKLPYATIENGHTQRLGETLSSDGDSADDELSSVEEHQKLLKVKPSTGGGDGDHLAKTNLISMAVFTDTHDNALFGGVSGGGDH